MKKYLPIIAVALLLLAASLCLAARYVVSPYKTILPIDYNKVSGTFYLRYNADRFYLDDDELNVIDNNYPSLSDYVPYADANYIHYETDPCFVAWYAAFDNNETDPCFVLWQSTFDNNETDPCFVAWYAAFDNNETDPCFVLWQSTFDNNETDPCFVAWLAADVNYTAFDAISDPNADANDVASLRAAIVAILDKLKISGVVDP